MDGVDLETQDIRQIFRQVRKKSKKLVAAHEIG